MAEDGNRPSFINVIFSSYLQFQTMDTVHNPVAKLRIVTGCTYIIRMNRNSF
jgi:hypothetical protein